MKFFKKLFNSKSENELIREKLGLSFDDFAVNLANLIDNENYNLVSEVAKRTYSRKPIYRCFNWEKNHGFCIMDIKN